MRRAVSVIVCVLMAGFYAGLNAQIPENARFQPGSYAQPYRPAVNPVVIETTNSATDEGEDEAGLKAENFETEWEKNFSPQTIVPPPPVLVPPYEVPHLTFVYNRWTGCFHITPYEPGYAANPSAFPVQTSPLHTWISSKSSAAQLPPQVPYMSYYDPDPVVLPAEIKMHSFNFVRPITGQQVMPLPMPKPAAAQPVAPPARTRLGERLRQNGTFFIP